MEDFKGIKGKWNVYPCVMCGNNEIHIQSEDKGRSLAIIPNHNKSDESNAQLIACAPELLDALQDIINKIREYGYAGHFSPQLHYADITINKALGKEDSHE